MTRLSATDCLVRGGSILRSNWRLAPLRWILALAMGLLSLLAIGLPVVVTGRELLTQLPENLASVQGWIDEWVAQIAEKPQLFAISLGGTFLLLAVAILAWAFTEAGSFGVLLNSDRQAPAKAPAGVWFDTFSLGDFFGWAGRYMWRFLALFLVYVALCLLLALLAVGLFALAAGSGNRWGTGAAVGLGCGGALPLAFLTLTLLAVFWLAMADLSSERSGTLVALGLGLRVLGRRLGAVLLLFVVWIVAAVGLSVAFSIPGIGLKAMVGGSVKTSVAIDLVLQLMQSFVAQFLHLWFAASFVALVRSERAAMDSTLPANVP